MIKISCQNLAFRYIHFIVAPKASIVLHTVGKEDSSSESVRMTLSANKPILYYLPATGMPFIDGASLIAAAKVSITNIKMR